MRIRSISPLVVGTPWRELTFVRLVTDDGLEGVGEVRMVNKTDTLLSCVAELGERYVLGADPFDTELLARRIQWNDYGRVGEVAQSALAAFDTACWDLMGQALGVPVWRLLGGRLRERVPAYANGWYRSERDPSAIAELAGKVVARGYRALKLDPFGAAAAELGPAELRCAVAIVAAVRDMVGPDVQLMIEMHGRFVPAAAIRVAAALEEFAPEWLEEPTPPYHPGSLKQVRAHTRLPLATGERAHTLSDLREIIEEGTADVIQADPTHFGGITGWRKLAGWAAAYDRLLAPHNVCGPVGTAAAVHLGVSTPGVKVVEHFNDFADPWVGELVDEAPAVDPRDGCFAAGDRPGLGLTLDADACRSHPRTRTMFDLFSPGWELREPRPEQSA